MAKKETAKAQVETTEIIEKAETPKAKKTTKAKVKKESKAKETVVRKQQKNIKKFAAIIRPVITEKTMKLIQEFNKVTVEVDSKSNRTEIKLAFEEIYQVRVKNVRIMHVLPRETKRGGRYKGTIPGYKKAIVTLQEGEALDLFKE
jgi:large subunit ribosomal protein L23